MKEYIERAVAVQELEVLRQEYEMHDDCDELVARRCRHALSAVPAADVAEVRHGRWEFLGPNNLNRDCMCGTCSACHVRSVYIVNTAICPNCGARMDQEAEHDKYPSDPL